MYARYLDKSGVLTGETNELRTLLTHFILAKEESRYQEDKIEHFKSTMLQSFPTKDLYKTLYAEDKEEEEVISVSEEEVDELMDLLSSLGFGNSADLGDPYA